MCIKCEGNMNKWKTLLGISQHKPGYATVTKNSYQWLTTDVHTMWSGCAHCDRSGTQTEKASIFTPAQLSKPCQREDVIGTIP